MIWAISYPHFVGVSAGSPIANRARIFNSGNSTSTYALLKVTASGCRFENLMFFQGSATAACGAVEINGGERNYIMATINLYMNIYILFIHLLNIFSALSGRD